MTIAIGVVQGLIFLGGVGVAIYMVGRLRGSSRHLRANTNSVEPSGLEAPARQRRLARPTLLLTPTDAPAFSKVGGWPELPSGVVWPDGAARDAPAFVAQISLTAVQANGGFDWLPETGSLYLFFDHWLNGSAGCGKLIFSHEPPAPAVPPPEALPKNQRFTEQRVAFRRFISLPSLDWLETARVVRWDPELVREADFGDGIEHRTGGYPGEIQGGQMAIESEYLHRGLTFDYREPVPDDVRRASRQWRLLLQIDSDPALGMNLWDGGRIYVFVRARDAKRGDFSKTVTITQSY